MVPDQWSRPCRNSPNESRKGYRPGRKNFPWSMGIPQAMDDLGVLPFQETNREKPPILCGLLKIVINNDNNNNRNNRNNRNRTQQRSTFFIWVRCTCEIHVQNFKVWSGLRAKMRSGHGVFKWTWIILGGSWSKTCPFLCPLDMVSKYMSVRKQQLLGDDHHQQKPCLTSLELPKWRSDRPKKTGPAGPTSASLFPNRPSRAWAVQNPVMIRLSLINVPLLGRKSTHDKLDILDPECWWYIEFHTGLLAKPKYPLVN